LTILILTDLFSENPPQVLSEAHLSVSSMSMSDYDEIVTLSTQRGKAVKAKNKELFLSTQIEEISFFLSSGYLSQDKLITEVVAVAEANEISKAVFVKESYFNKGMKTHDAFLIYYVVRTSKGWKIYRASNAK
jgi:hypothetical protein